MGKKTESDAERPKGPGGRPRIGSKVRVRTTLNFDPGFMKKAKARAKREGKSLSLWLEDLGKAALKK